MVAFGVAVVGIPDGVLVSDRPVATPASAQIDAASTAARRERDIILEERIIQKAFFKKMDEVWFGTKWVEACPKGVAGFADRSARHLGSPC